MKLKIALIGASGFVGSAVLNEVLNRGHQVTAIVRNPEKIDIINSNLTVLKVDVLNETETIEAITGHDLVLSAFNSGFSGEGVYDKFIAGSKAIQAATKKAGVPRLFVVGGAGSLFIGDNQLVDAPDFPADYKNGALAARDYLKILQEEKDLAWTFISPAIEMHPGTSGIRKGEYRKGLNNPVFDTAGRSLISVEDLAVAIADEAEANQYKNQRFTVAY